MKKEKEEKGWEVPIGILLIVIGIFLNNFSVTIIGLLSVGVELKRK